MNKIKKYIFVLLAVIGLCSYVANISGVTDDIANAIKAGNSTELTQYFNSNVDITLPGYSSSCSKAQAEMITRDFFKKYPPKSFKVIHQGSSADGSQFSICSYTSTAKSFRVYFLVKKFGEKMLIQQLKFESE